MKKKMFNIIGLFVCMMAILACSDSESSNPSASPNGFVGFRMPMALDEANQSYLALQIRDKDVCIQKDESLEFATVKDTSRINGDYAFIGDTLVTFNKKDMDSYGGVFVGGKNGQIKSKWKMINSCRYIPKTNSIKCLDQSQLSARENSMIAYYEYTQDSLFVSFTDLNGKEIDPYAMIKDEFDDYTNSYYMETNMYVVIATYEGVGLGGFDYPEETFYGGADIEKYASTSNVVINSRDKNRISFTVNGQTFEMEFTKAFHASSLFREYGEVSAVMKSDNGTCTLDYVFDSQVTPEICRDENRELMKFNTEYNLNGDTSNYGTDEYHMGNATEFKECIERLVKK